MSEGIAQGVHQCINHSEETEKVFAVILQMKCVSGAPKHFLLDF